jgi:hypothetical protein
MKQKRYTEDQIFGILNETEIGTRSSAAGIG